MQSRLIFLREWAYAAFLQSTCCLLQFEETLGMADPKEALQELIDPRLGGDYPIASVLKVSDAGKLGSAISFSSTVAQNKHFVLNRLLTCVLCTRSLILQSHVRMKSPG